MRIWKKTYDKLCDKGSSLNTSHLCMDSDGNVLPAVTPDSFIYFACGEEMLVYVDANLVLSDVEWSY